jgi:hypothetical protein
VGFTRKKAKRKMVIAFFFARASAAWVCAVGFAKVSLYRAVERQRGVAPNALHRYTDV